MIVRVSSLLRRLTRAPARWRAADRQRRHGIMFAVDIAGFSPRPAHLQAQLRKTLYSIIHDACDQTGLTWRRCLTEDRGDGMFVIGAADADFGTILNPLTAHIGAALTHHNHTADPAARIQLRMAVHAGFFQPDDHGITSPDLNHLFRLLDAPTLKAHLATHHTDLALIVSDHLYQIATSYNQINPDHYQPTTVNLKETNTQAWIRNPPPPTPTPPTPQRLALLIPITLVQTNTPEPETGAPTTITPFNLNDLLRHTHSNSPPTRRPTT